jgi:hypothetical protein
MKDIIMFTAFDKAPDNVEYKEWCFESWKAWSKKHNIDLVTFEDPIMDVQLMKPTWQRWNVFNILENNVSLNDYDQIALIDIDTLIHPQAPNFFDINRHNTGVGVVHDDLMVEWIHNSIKGYKHFFPDISLDWTRYFNTGFVILKNNEPCRKACASIVDFYTTNREELQTLQHTTLRKGSDQTPVNYIFTKFELQKEFLNRKWNFTHLHLRGAFSDDIINFSELAYVYHFNGFEKRLRNELMKKYWNVYLKPLI